MKNKLLIIEDCASLQFSFKHELSRDFELLQATTLDSARSLIDDSFVPGNKPLDIICFDFNLGDRDNTLALIMSTRERVSNTIMVAMSSSDFGRDMQIDAGCDIALDSKGRLGEFLRSDPEFLELFKKKISTSL